jgi:hypothetical protein
MAPMNDDFPAPEGPITAVTLPALSTPEHACRARTNGQWCDVSNATAGAPPAMSDSNGSEVGRVATLSGEK